MHIYILRLSCFREISALCVSWITYGHLYDHYIHIYMYIYICVCICIHLYVVISGNYIVTIYLYHSAEY